MKALLNTNILIDFLNGIEAARLEIKHYESPLISPTTWMEVMVGQVAGEEEMLRQFLARFRQIDIDQEVAEFAVAIRRKHKDFPADDPGIRMPYSV